MAQFKIEIPDTDVNGKEITEIEVGQLMHALYSVFGWEKGSVRVLVMKLLKPGAKQLPKIPIAKIEIERSH